MDDEQILRRFEEEKEYTCIRLSELRAELAACRERRAGAEFDIEATVCNLLRVLWRSGNPELAHAIAAVQAERDAWMASLAEATERLEEQIADGRGPTLAQKEDAVERSERLNDIEDRHDRLIAEASAWLENHA